MAWFGSSPVKSIHVFVVAAAWSLQLHAATEVPASGEASDELDRVEIHGLRPDLWELRRAVVETEDRFYAKYNELNQADEFDLKCRVEAPTGSRLTRRTCRPLYQEDAVQEGAKQAVELRQKFQSDGGEALLGSNSPPVPAAIAITARRTAFERNMRSVVQRHPELLTLLEERIAAARALEKAERRGAGKTGGTEDVGNPAEKMSD